MAGITIDQAWAMASDTAGLQAAADEFGWTAKQVSELGELVSDKAQKLEDSADTLAADAAKGVNQIGDVLVREGWLTNALGCIGADEHADALADLETYCEEQVKTLTTRAKSWDTATREVVATLHRQRSGIDDIASAVSAVRARVIGAL